MKYDMMEFYKFLGPCSAVFSSVYNSRGIGSSVLASNVFSPSLQAWREKSSMISVGHANKEGDPFSRVF